jgi:hypothetical protein
MTTSSPRIFALSLRAKLFDDVKESMSIGLDRTVDDKEAEAFLNKNTALLGSIIQYDELDTTDRESIWERCRSWQRPV